LIEKKEPIQITNKTIEIINSPLIHSKPITNFNYFEKNKNGIEIDSILKKTNTYTNDIPRPFYENHYDRNSHNKINNNNLQYNNSNRYMREINNINQNLINNIENENLKKHKRKKEIEEINKKLSELNDEFIYIKTPNELLEKTIKLTIIDTTCSSECLKNFRNDLYTLMKKKNINFINEDLEINKII
jgi:hypothetical protein